jgi:hypothetical protein
MEGEGADRSTAGRACIPQQQQFGLGSGADADGEESPCTEQLKNLGSRLQRCHPSDWPDPLARPLCAQSAPDTCSHMGLLDRPPPHDPSIASFALISPSWICTSLASAAVLCPPRRALPPNPGPSGKSPSLNPNAAPPHL